MKRFLTTVSSTILASSLVILPVASFAQDSSKTTAPATQSTAVQPSGMQTGKPETAAKTDVKPDAHAQANKTHVQVNKSETHGMSTGANPGTSSDTTTKTPATGSQVKG